MLAISEDTIVLEFKMVQMADWTETGNHIFERTPFWIIRPCAFVLLCSFAYLTEKEKYQIGSSKEKSVYHFEIQRVPEKSTVKLWNTRRADLQLCDSLDTFKDSKDSWLFYDIWMFSTSEFKVFFYYYFYFSLSSSSLSPSSPSSSSLKNMVLYNKALWIKFPLLHIYLPHLPIISKKQEWFLVISFKIWLQI